MITNIALVVLVSVGWVGMVYLAYKRRRLPLARWELPAVMLSLGAQIGGLVVMEFIAVSDVITGRVEHTNFFGLYALMAWIAAMLASMPLLVSLGTNRERLRREGHLRTRDQ